MRVVQINCAASGSTGKIAKAIHYVLLAQGDESYIFYGFGGCDEKNVIRIGNDFDLHLHAVLSRNLGRQGYFSHAATNKLIRQIQSIDPDVIHLHNLHGSYLNLPMLFRFLRTSRAKILITLHDCWLFTGKCAHFTEVNCFRWKENCGQCPNLSVYPRSKVDTTEQTLADKKKWLSGFGERMRIITVSNWLCDTAKESFLKQYPIQTIYNGIDINIFKPVPGNKIREKYGLQKNYIILGVAYHWGERKGLKEFLKLADQLDENEKIVLIGLTQEQIADMPDQILGITKTESQQELVEWYSAADVFINPSKEETFGLVTAEAMACGTPAIVYQSTACAEVTDDSCVVMPADQNCYLRDAVNEIKSRRKSNDCRQHIIDSFSLNKMVEGYLDAYKKD